MKKILAFVLSIVILSNLTTGLAFAQNFATESAKEPFTKNVLKTEKDTQKAKKLSDKEKNEPKIEKPILNQINKIKNFLVFCLSGCAAFLFGSVYGQRRVILEEKEKGYLEGKEKGYSEGYSAGMLTYSSEHDYLEEGVHYGKFAMKDDVKSEFSNLRYSLYNAFQPINLDPMGFCAKPHERWKHLHCGAVLPEKLTKEGDLILSRDLVKSITEFLNNFVDFLNKKVE